MSQRETSAPISSALLAALRFASVKHSGQRRKDGVTPYINHPIQVAEVMSRVGGVVDLEALQAALLHDTLEDTATTSSEIENAFGRVVRILVEEVTDDKHLGREDRQQRQIKTAHRLSPRAKLIRVADKICNIGDLNDRFPQDWSPKRKRAYLNWAEQVVAECQGCNSALEEHFQRLLEDKRRELGR